MFDFSICAGLPNNVHKLADTLRFCGWLFFFRNGCSHFARLGALSEDDSWWSFGGP